MDSWIDPWRKMFMIQKLGPKRPTVVKELSCTWPEFTFLTSRFFVESNSYFNNQSPYKLLWLALYFPRIILGVEHGRFGSTFLRSLGETLLPGWQMFHRRLFPIERWLVTRERCDAFTRKFTRACYWRVQFARISRTQRFSDFPLTNQTL